MKVKFGSFEWDPDKELINVIKHGVDFHTAARAFLDAKRIIAKDELHSVTEERLFCIGKVAGGILTVRFTYRKTMIRIIGAGYWRKGEHLYEKENG